MKTLSNDALPDEQESAGAARLFGHAERIRFEFRKVWDNGRWLVKACIFQAVLRESACGNYAVSAFDFFVRILPPPPGLHFAI